MVRDGIPIDFRSLAHRLGRLGRSVHPTDPLVHLTPTGVALIADGNVAEAASPPVFIEAGCVHAVEAWSLIGAGLLSKTLDPGDRLAGGSTHVSVEVPASLNDAVCVAYAKTYAPGFMLLLDRIGSPGLLVRPRPRRTELCGEFAVGQQLRAAVAYAAGSVLAAVEDLQTGLWRGPPELVVEVEPARRRYGWYVPRTGFGPDLYAAGREASLRRVDGSSVVAQRCLELGWARARDALAPHVRDADLVDVDDVVAGRAPLPTEHVAPGADPLRRPGAIPPAAIGRATTVGGRPGFEVQLRLATWDVAIFAVRRASASGVAVVPAGVLGQFLGLLAAGALDGVIGEYLSLGSVDRVVANVADTNRPGLYDDVHRSDALLPRDRIGVGPGAVSGVRLGKLVTPDAGAVPGEAPREVPGSRDGPTIGGIVWFILLVVAMVAGLVVARTTASPSATTAPTSTTTSRQASTTPAPAPTNPVIRSAGGGWDHPPFDAQYINAETGRPVSGRSVLLECLRVGDAAPGSLLKVTWSGPSGAIEGVGQLDGGVAIVTAGINQTGTYVMKSVQIAPAGASPAYTPLPMPDTPPTVVVFPAESRCTA